jgi:DNA segregation ATPase FtsK/SpoIIIE, S-DNA-T family
LQVSKKTKENTHRSRIPRWVWMLIILSAIAVIVWQWSNITNLAEAIANNIFNALGWGLIIILVFLLALILVILIKRVPAFLQWLRIAGQILGAASLALGVWGILAFFNLGGNFGHFLTGENIVLGILRVLGFFVLGILLLAPVHTSLAIFRFFRWLFVRSRREPIIEHLPSPSYNQMLTPTEKVLPETPKKFSGIFRPIRKPITPKPYSSDATVSSQPVQQVPPASQSTKPQQPPQDLKQVAQDVWKKYGESSSLITVDGWKLPPIEILEHSTEIELSPADNNQRAKMIEEALASYGVEAKVVQINPGPTVTQFGLEPGWDRKFREVKEKDREGNYVTRQEEISRTRVKVERIASLSNNLAMTLAAPSIRIEAPIPGKAVVGIEVPNTISSVVTVRGVVETNSFQKLLAKSKMTIALGKGAGGEAFSADLTKMPHLLIAGATGSGKTVCLNAIVCSLLLHNTPDEVLFIMVDPKRVELTPFNSIPHLAAPVIVETEKALNILRWLSQEMDSRYKVMAAANVRNIDGYNKNKKGVERMPFLVLIIDELADLMMTGNSTEVEHNLCRLAQLARATGIHLVVATQRPSVDVVTGLIKANFPTRISFAVTSQVDSRTILDGVGAEKLLGKGDMLYMPTDSDKPKRLQGCFVSDPEVERLVYFWSSQNKEQKRPSLNIEEIAVTTGKSDIAGDDALMEEARKLAKEHEHISTSFLQRRLRIGYPRAARIMEKLEEEGHDVEDDIGDDQPGI